MSIMKVAEDVNAAGVQSTEKSFRLPGTAVVALLLLAIVLFGLIRYRLRNQPLERDEGEYAYSGQLLVEGIPPYQLAYNMKLPGIYAAYAAVMGVFGETPAGIHLGLLILNAATLIALYFLTAHLCGRVAGVIAAWSWGLLSTSTSVLGFEAHATNFVALPVVLGIWILLEALDRNRLWLLFMSGSALGIGVLMKQHGVFFVLFGLCYLAVRGRSFTTEGTEEHRVRALVTRAGIFAAGATLPYLITCFWLYRAGVFPEFWFWTVSYAGEYSKVGLRRAVRAFFENSSVVISPAVLIWALAAVGITALWWEGRARQHRNFVLLLLGFSFLSLCPGAYFRLHYFILILPVIAMLTGVAVSAGMERLEKSFQRRTAVAAPLAVFMVCFGVSVYGQHRQYFLEEPASVFVASYPGSPFIAAQQVAEFVEAHSSSADRIAVIGSEPEIYFYAHRHSSTGYLYMYSLIVHHKYSARMREEFLSELERNQPQFLVYVDVWDSWGERQVAQAQPFLDRLQQFMSEGYEREGVAEIGETTHYVWGEWAKDYQPQSTNVIYVMRRKQK